MIQIIDTHEQLLSLLGRSFDMCSWKKYADAISPSLYSKCLDDASDYDFDKDCLPVLNRALMSRDIIDIAHKNFTELTENVNERIQRSLSGGIQSDIVFYLGLCNAAGWATELDSNPTVFIGCEKVVELNWHGRREMAGLIYHELGHLWHFQNRTEKSFEIESAALWQLYSEGVAMYIEQTILGDETFYHQDKNGWLSWCRYNQTSLFGDFYSRVCANQSIQDYFGDWCQYREHSDIGYYLGAVLVRSLLNTMPEAQMINCSKEIIESELAHLAAE